MEWRHLFGFQRCFCHKSWRTQEHRNGLLDGCKRFCFPSKGKFFLSTIVWAFKYTFFFVTKKIINTLLSAALWHPCESPQWNSTLPSHHQATHLSLPQIHSLKMVAKIMIRILTNQFPLWRLTCDSNFLHYINLRVGFFKTTWFCPNSSPVEVSGTLLPLDCNRSS